MSNGIYFLENLIQTGKKGIIVYIITKNGDPHESRCEIRTRKRGLN